VFYVTRANSFPLIRREGFTNVKAPWHSLCSYFSSCNQRLFGCREFKSVMQSEFAVPRVIA